jgi:aromatic ring-cleaving dioxygenase
MTSEAGDAPYHAHIYYSADERSVAVNLREKLRSMPRGDPLSQLRFVGELRDQKAGPHITAQFEIHFEERLLPVVEAELVRSGLPVELDLTVLDPPGVNQGIARFGKTDF